MMDVSIITPAYNASSTIKRLLNALSVQTYDKKKYELVVVDDGSTDDTRQIINGYAKTSKYKIRLIEQEHMGRGVARNNGIRRAKGKVLALTDADCIPNRDWIENCFDEVITHKHLLVSGRTYSNENVIYPWRISPAGQHWITANMAIKKSIIGKVRFRLPNCEETDFIIQLEEKFSKNIRKISEKMKVEHPVNVLKLRGVLRYARRRRQEVLLLKLHGRKVYNCMNPLFRPIIFDKFSVQFLSLIIAVTSVAIFGYKGLFAFLIILGLYSIAFVWFGYKVVVRDKIQAPIRIKDRIKTLAYFIVYNLSYFLARVEGSIKYRKIVF